MTKVRTIVETALFIACRLFKNDQKSINLVTLLLQGGANVNSMRTETLGGDSIIFNYLINQFGCFALIDHPRDKEGDSFACCHC